MLLSIYRMNEHLGSLFIAPAWTAYAFVIFIWAYRSKVADIAISAMPIIALGLFRFLIVDFSSLSGGERIISLIVMGTLIFSGGYVYRKLAVTDQLIPDNQ